MNFSFSDGHKTLKPNEEDGMRLTSKYGKYDIMLTTDIRIDYNDAGERKEHSKLRS